MSVSLDRAGTTITYPRSWDDLLGLESRVSLVAAALMGAEELARGIKDASLSKALAATAIQALVLRSKVRFHIARRRGALATESAPTAHGKQRP